MDAYYLYKHTTCFQHITTYSDALFFYMLSRLNEKSKLCINKIIKQQHSHNAKLFIWPNAHH